MVKPRPTPSNGQLRLRRWLLIVNYSIAAIVLVFFILTAETFSIIDWVVCAVLMGIIPVVATYIQLTQIGLGKGVVRMLSRSRR